MCYTEFFRIHAKWVVFFFFSWWLKEDGVGMSARMIKAVCDLKMEGTDGLKVSKTFMKHTAMYEIWRYMLEHMLGFSD